MCRASSVNMTSTVEEHAYEKEFCKSFALETGWPLPNADDMFAEPAWQLSEFQELKVALNRTKQKLNFFNLDQWHAHTAKMNPAGLVIDHVRKVASPDFLTQAWCKFYEIACTSDLLPRDATTGGGGGVFTVHLCEAPGAFVSSLNHYIAANHERVRLEWLAMTLNPYHEANGPPNIVNDDRLILNTLDNWEWGPDYTGDIFQPGYAEHLRRVVLERPGRTVCLVTADGSVDCSDDPGEQENAVAWLHDHETMVALNVLQDGGSLVLKMFTVFECRTICRLYLLCCLFRAVTVRKPATSKPGNSEVYVVCTGYGGRSLAEPFVRAYFDDGGDLRRPRAAATFRLSDIPDGFRVALHECSAYFCRMQTLMIDGNVDAWWSGKEERYRDMEPVRRAVCFEFVARYGVRPIRAGRELMAGGGFAPRVRVNRKRRGCGVGGGASYAERTLLRHASDPRQEADVLCRAIAECSREWTGRRSHRDSVYWGRREHLTLDLSDVRYRLGKPVTAVRGSKFCSESLVHCRLRALAKFPRPVAVTRPDADAAARSLYFRFKSDRPDATVCDVTAACGADDDAAAQQYRCLTVVIEMLRCRVADGGDLLLVGYPLYTQVAVACFYAVASMFDAHSLLRPDRQHGHAFAFVRYARHDGWLRALDACRERLVPAANGGMALVSWMPIKALLEQKAYAAMVSVNNLCIVHEVEPILAAFLNPDPCV